MLLASRRTVKLRIVFLAAEARLTYPMLLRVLLHVALPAPFTLYVLKSSYMLADLEAWITRCQARKAQIVAVMWLLTVSGWKYLMMMVVNVSVPFNLGGCLSVCSCTCLCTTLIYCLLNFSYITFSLRDVHPSSTAPQASLFAAPQLMNHGRLNRSHF